MMVVAGPRKNAPKFIPNVVEGLSDFLYNTIQVNNRFRTETRRQPVAEKSVENHT